MQCETCPVCMEPIAPGARAVRECGHAACVPCLAAWAAAAHPAARARCVSCAALGAAAAPAAPAAPAALARIRRRERDRRRRERDRRRRGVPTHSCAICLEECAEEDVVALVGCCHVWCRSCLARWRRETTGAMRDRCFMCRARNRVDEDAEARVFAESRAAAPRATSRSGRAVVAPRRFGDPRDTLKIPRREMTARLPW